MFAFLPEQPGFAYELSRISFHSPIDITPLDSDIEPIERLVKVCNNLQLDPIHLQDVVTDYLATV